MKKKNNKSKNSNYSLAHVLYQKLGKDWYAFAEVDGDCFMTKVEAELAEAYQLDDSQTPTTSKKLPRAA